VRAVNLAGGDLAEVICARLGPGYAREPALTCLSDSPDGRRVTELRFRPKDRGRADVRIIAKQFAGETGAATYAAMKALEAADAARAKDAPLAMPRALFYAPRLRTLALEPAPGRSYRELASDAAFTDHLRLAGAALAGLHALHVPELRPTTVDDHMAELMRPAPDALAMVLPEHAGLVAEVVDGLRATERRFRAAGAIPQVPVHRDFHLGQLFRDRDRVAIIDWDLVALGDPALDLGNFAVYLRTRVPHAATRGIEAFFAGYVARAGRAALARVALYEALTYLRLACKRVRLRPEGFEADAVRMLRLARERLP
jgi:aminoglycoside phosphotransferase (APT) family kinase protein